MTTFLKIFLFFLDSFVRFVLVMVLLLGDMQFLNAAFAEGHPHGVDNDVINPLPDVPGAIAGYTEGSFSVNESGSASYDVPLNVPPGTSGMQPSLTLAYNIRGSNSILGVGWSLSGLSAVTRCGSTLAQDGAVDGIDFDGGDKFCLDGQRLIAVNGTYGADGTEYRTENDTFSQIFSYGVAGTGPASWSVKSKDGITSSYATTADSRVEAQGRSDVLIWQVSKVEDTVGNYYTVSYYEDTPVGESYPLEIKYTGNTSEQLVPINSVRFSYEERNDATPRFLSGSQTILTKRLNNIALYQNSTFTWQYKLQYVENTIGQSYLSRLELCDSDTTCLSPTTFDWEQEDFGFQAPVKWYSTSSQRHNYASYRGSLGHYTDLIDMNGDGRLDRVSYFDKLNTQTSGIWVSINNGVNFDPPANWLSASSDTDLYPSYRGVEGVYNDLVDVTGDGLPDRVSYRNHADNAPGFWVSVNTGTGLAASVKWYETPTKRHHYVSFGVPGGDSYTDLRDMNGDGLLDRIKNIDKNVQPQSAPAFWVDINNGTGFDPSAQWFQTNSDPRFHYPTRAGKYGVYLSLLDMNGDGLLDRVGQVDSVSGQGNGLWVALSTGSGFDPAQKWYTGYSPTYNFMVETSSAHPHVFASLIDMNGDGLPDKVGYYNVLTGEEDGFWVATNTGAGFLAPVKWYDGFEQARNYSTAGTSSQGIYSHLIDVNNDGLPDRVGNREFLTNNGGEGFWVGLNTGTGFLNPVKWYDGFESTDNFPSYRGTEGIYTDLRDINGDGFLDRVGYRNHLTGEAGGFWVALNKGKPRFLKSVTTGHGYTVSISYAPLSDSTIYVKDSDAVYPAVDLQGPMYVVSHYDTDNGLGGLRTVSYAYEGLKVLQDGRGFCGFRQVTKTDNETGIETTTFYRQDHPYKSYPFKVETRLADNTLIKRETDTWNVTTFPSGNYFPHVTQSISEEFKLNGTPLNTTTLSKTFDAFGNPKQIIETHSDGYKVTTNNTYINDQTLWFLGRLTQTEVIQELPNTPTITNLSTFKYDPITGLLSEETIEPNHPTLWSKKEYTRDDFGNIIESEITAAQVAARSQITEYDDNGAFATLSKNALGHEVNKTYDAHHGKVEILTDPNGLSKNYTYDPFGRLTHERRADGTETRTLRHFVNASAPPLAVYYERTDSSGNAPHIVYYDLLDREIRIETVGFNGQRIFVDKDYNQRGELVRQSEPYFEGSTPLWINYQYDILGRTTQVTAPGNRISTTQYDGYQTTATNPKNQTAVRITNSRNQLIESRDDLNNALRYSYDSVGNLVEIRDSVTNITSMQYDLLGNKTSITDPNSGTISYTYNGLKQMTRQVDAKNQAVDITYDLLGRVLTRTEVEGTHTWEYDTRSMGIGKLSRVISAGNHTESYYYDSLSRLVNTVTDTIGGMYQIFVSYDPYGRENFMQYPSGFAVSRSFNELGYLSSVFNPIDGTVYWEAMTLNARGQLEQQFLGNGLVTSQAYDPATGFLDSIQTTGVQNLAFQFDTLGNLTQRRDLFLNATEDFGYDDLNRLTSAQVVGGAAISVTYDALGNIRTRSDVGTYNYRGNGAGPHAVSSITGPKANVYTYDANGNRIGSNNGSVQYTSSNKPSLISRGNKSLEFFYSATGSRYTQIVRTGSTIDKTKIYIGSMFEREITPTSAKDIHFIKGGDSTIAIHTEEAHQQDKLQYLHKDHLGSIQAITDETGNVVEVLSFDAWGNRRNPDWSTATAPIQSTTDRGFTGHEQLDVTGMIHMNGRVYDPVIGRFLSPDPNVQAPENMQSLNRYSYVLNNPLSLTDPSGFFFKSLFKSIAKFFKKHRAAILSTAIFFATSGWGSGIGFNLVASATTFGPITPQAALLAQGVGAGISGGLASASAAAVSGGSISDIFRAAVTGGASSGISAGVFYGIGDTFGHGTKLATAQHAKKIVAHGTAGGLLTAAQGGKFEHGFISNAFTEAFAPGISRVSGNSIYGVAAAAVVGGTTSELGGGKFSNGAVTAAFARLFNNNRGRLDPRFTSRLDPEYLKLYTDIGKAGFLRSAASLQLFVNDIVNTALLPLYVFNDRFSEVLDATGQALMVSHPSVAPLALGVEAISVVTGLGAIGYEHYQYRVRPVMLNQFLRADQQLGKAITRHRDFHRTSCYPRMAYVGSCN